MNADRYVPWSCRAVRAWRGVVGGQPGVADDRRPRGVIARHITRCAGCQHYFAQVGTLESALRSAAPRTHAAAADDLHVRIMRAVTEAAPAEPAWRHLRRPALVGVAVALVLAAITAGLQIRETLAPRRAIHRPVIAPAATAVVVTSTTRSGATSMPAAAGERLDPLAPVTSALLQDPLQAEVDSVYADARHAVQFLALNFLPAGAVADNGNGRSSGMELRRGGG